MFKSNVDLINGKIMKVLIIFAIPMFVSSLFQQAYNTVDIMIVGNFLGDTSLAAIGASAAVFELLIGFSLGVGNGFSIVIARAFGANDNETVKKSMAGALIIGGIITLIVMIIAWIGLYPLLEILNTPDNIIEESYSYISVIAMAVGVAFVYNLFSSALRAIGNSVMPLVFLILASISNIVLDILFITTFGMGIRGAAFATVIAQGIAGVLCIIYTFKKCPILIPEKRHFNVGRDLYKELLGQGLSMGIMLLIVSTGTVILQTSINGFGHLIIAGHTAARKVGSFTMIPSGVLSMSLATFVSQNKGADNGYRIRRAVYLTNIIAVGWGIVVVVGAITLGPWLMKTLSGSSEKELIENGARYLLLNAPFYAVLGILLNLRNALQGIGEKVLPLISSVIEFVGKIIFVATCIPSLGYLGVIICEPIIWCFMCIQLAWSFYKHPYIKANKEMKLEVDREKVLV